MSNAQAAPDTLPLKLTTDLDLPQETLDKSFTLVRTAYPHGEGLYDFEVAVPLDWNVRFLDTGEPAPDGQPIPMLFVTPSDHQKLQLAVLCARLPREVHPQDWLERWLQSTGQGFIDMRNWRTQYGLLADILSGVPDEDVTGFQRTMVIRDGDRVFVLLAATTEEDEPHVSFMQTMFLVALKTFQLKAPTKELFAEPFHPEQISGGAPFSFLLPDSWTSTVAGDAPPMGDALTLQNGEAGTILLATTPAPDWADQIEQTMLGKIDAGEITISEMNPQYIKQKRGDLKVTLRGGNATLNGQELFLTTARFHDDRRSGAAVLVSPADTVSFQDYAINRRAFEVLVDTLVPVT